MKTRLATILAAVAIFTSGMRAADYKIEANPIKSDINDTKKETVMFENVGNVLGFQCDIVPGEGLTINPSDVKLADRAASHDLRATELSNGAILVTATSFSEVDDDDIETDAISGNSGALFTFDVKMPAEEMHTSITLSYIVLSVEGAGRVKLPDITIPVTVGDLTGIDGVADEDGDATYYDLRGIKVDNPQTGVYIRIVGNNASKVLVK